MNEQEPAEFEVCSYRQRITVYATTCGRIAIKQDCGDERTCNIVVIDRDCINALHAAIEVAKEGGK